MFCCFNIVKSLFSNRERHSAISYDSNNPYIVLNVPRRASLEEIRVARKRILEKYHPDRLIGFSAEFIAKAEERSKKAIWAYLMLKKKRRRHHKRAN